MYVCMYVCSPGGNTPQSSSYTATYHPSWKVSELDEPDMQDTAGDAGTSSKVMYFYGPVHMAEQKQGKQLEHTYSSSVEIRGVALRTCRKQWTIGRGGERGSGISMLMARQDDDDDVHVCTYVCMWMCVNVNSTGIGTFAWLISTAEQGNMIRRRRIWREKKSPFLFAFLFFFCVWVLFFYNFISTQILFLNYMSQLKISRDLDALKCPKESNSLSFSIKSNLIDLSREQNFEIFLRY